MTWESSFAKKNEGFNAVIAVTCNGRRRGGFLGKRTGKEKEENRRTCGGDVVTCQHFFCEGNEIMLFITQFVFVLFIQ